MADTSPPLGDPRPLLAFGAPHKGRIPPPDRRPWFRRVKSPGPGRQGPRLAPQFRTLQDALSSGRAQLAEMTTAPDSELVAVFDLAGTVDQFVRACARMEGLEFLVELEEDRVAPDDLFFYEDGGVVSDDNVPQSLYMVMSNAQAVNQLVRLFEIWQQNPSVRFERGLNPLKQVFALLRSVRRWGPEDRIRETGLLEQWKQDFAVTGPMDSARVEIEFWFRSKVDQQLAAQASVEQLITRAGGRTLRSSIIPEIEFHGLLADIPYSQVQAVLAQGPGAIALLTTESVMFVSPARPMTIPIFQPTEYALTTLGTELPTGSPRVALLDGVPLSNHVALQGRLIIDDPDDRAAKYTTGQRSHGTAMASLIVHGDLSTPGIPMTGPLYVRPILEPHVWATNQEIVPPDELLVDLVNRAFRRMFDGDDGHPPSAPSVRVVNLSIGDPGHVFVRRMSPLAKLIDWLSHRYNVVVIVSAGNHKAYPSIPRAAIADPEIYRSAAARWHHSQARHHRLLSPAEGVNVITVGAQHADDAQVTFPDSVIDIFLPEGPAGYSANGFGFRRSVKPEILMPGGREIFLRPPDGDEDVVLERARTEAAGPGIRVAAPSGAGSVDGTLYTFGSSNSTALATRTIDQIFEALEHLDSDGGEFDFPDAQYHPVLAKTLLVHAARWGDMGKALGQSLGLEPRRMRSDLTQLLGYGPVHPERVTTADRVRAVLIGASSIGRDERETFYFPLPPVLSATTEWRRLTVTLGWLSPINTRSQKHRVARLIVSPPRSELGVDPIEADHHAVIRGTLQHQILEGSAAVAFIDGDSLAFSVDCRVDAGTLQTPVRYAIAVSLEVSAAVQVDLHAQVRQVLRAQVQQRLRDRVITR